MRVLVFLVFALLTCGHATPEIPIWGGAAAFSVKVNMTDIADSPFSPKWTFQYFYMSDASTNSTLSRYEHDAAQHDEVGPAFALLSRGLLSQHTPNLHATQ